MTWGGNDIALSKDVLPLSGGTMTGGIVSSTAYMLMGTGTNRQYNIGGSNPIGKGAFLVLNGCDYANNGGAFQLVARDANGNGASLQGSVNGTLFWNGKVISANGGRLKSASGTKQLVQGQYTDVVSITLDKSISNSWIVIGWSSLTSSVNATYVMILKGISTAYAVRYNGSGGGGASIVLAKTITENTTVYLSVNSGSGTPTANGVLYAFPIV